jgi:PleD family two-component response regulator
VGEGTSVKLLFRTASEDGAKEAGDAEDEAGQPEPKRVAASVLVIDDDPDVRAFIAATLEEQGYRVRQAADGAQGIKEAARD